MILGITGYKRSGKDTVASLLKARHRYHVYGMADPMYAMVAVGLGLVTEEGLASGRIRSCMMGATGKPTIVVDKEAIIPELGCSLRHILQTLGTEWGRETISPQVWITRFNAWLDNRGYPGDVAIPDVRFDNEAEAIRDMGGVVIDVQRPDLEGGDAHASESGVRADLIDHIILNDGSKPELLMKVNDLLLDFGE